MENKKLANLKFSVIVILFYYLTPYLCLTLMLCTPPICTNLLLWQTLLLEAWFDL